MTSVTKVGLFKNIILDACWFHCEQPPSPISAVNDHLQRPSCWFTWCCLLQSVVRGKVSHGVTIMSVHAPQTSTWAAVITPVEPERSTEKTEANNLTVEKQSTDTCQCIHYSTLHSAVEHQREMKVRGGPDKLHS